jgi:hypothetical protein
MLGWVVEWLYRSATTLAVETPVVVAGLLGFSGVVLLVLLGAIGALAYMFNPFPAGSRKPTRPPFEYKEPAPFTVSEQMASMYLAHSCAG